MVRRYTAEGTAQRLRLKAAVAIPADSALSIVDGMASPTSSGEYKADKAIKGGSIFWASYLGLPAGGEGASVSNGDTVAVRNSAGTDSHNATAVVTGTTLTGVNLAATVAMVDSTDTPVIQNSAGTTVGTPGTVVVTAGALTAVRTPATSAVVTNAQALVVPVTGTYATTATVTVAGGVVTAIALS